MPVGNMKPGIGSHAFRQGVGLLPSVRGGPPAGLEGGRAAIFRAMAVAAGGGGFVVGGEIAMGGGASPTRARAAGVGADEVTLFVVIPSGRGKVSHELLSFTTVFS